MSEPIKERRTVFARLAESGPLVLAALLGIVLSAWAFILITDAVAAGTADKLDQRVLNYIRQHPGPESFRDGMDDLTSLGSPPVLMLAVAMTSGFLIVQKRYRTLAWLIMAVAGGATLTFFLKEMIDRVPPGHPAWLPKVGYTPSYPSGHSMMSAMVFLTIGTIIAQTRKSRVTALYCLATAAVLTFIVGATRVILCIHWPTDVLAGWAAGLVWALLCWVISDMLRRRWLR